MAEHVPGDDDEFPVIPTPLGFLKPASDEESQRIKAHLQKASMEANDRMHSMFRMLNALPLDDLHALRTLLEQIVRSPKSRQTADYFQGLVAGIMLTRDICPGCGKDHGQELLEMGSTDEPPTS
jgi:hypothetical protein